MEDEAKPALDSMAMYEIRQKLAEDMIRELNAEIDEDTIRRFNDGDRLIRTEHGPEWVYVTDENRHQITDPERLKQLIGHLMY